MSSGQNNNSMGGGFTIPKKIPKKQRNNPTNNSTPSNNSSLLPQVGGGGGGVNNHHHHAHHSSSVSSSSRASFSHHQNNNNNSSCNNINNNNNNNSIGKQQQQHLSSSSSSMRKGHSHYNHPSSRERSPPPPPPPPPTTTTTTATPSWASSYHHHHLQQQQQQQEHLHNHHDSSSRIQIKSLHPFLIKIKLDGIPLNNGGIPSSSSSRTRKSLHYPQNAASFSSTSQPPLATAPPSATHDVPSTNNNNHDTTTKSSSSSPNTLRSSSRTPKKKRKIYVEELEDTDTDDLMNSSEEEAAEKRRAKRIVKKKKSKKANNTGSSLSMNNEEGEGQDEEEEGEVLFEGIGSGGSSNLAAMGDAEMQLLGANIYDIESPPSGELNCLWYSREPFLHVFVLEKILGWKTRLVVKLESCEDTTTTTTTTTTAAVAKKEGEQEQLLKDGMLPLASKLKKMHVLDSQEASKLKDKALVDAKNDFRKRVEISRLHPAGCPSIKKIAAEKEVIRANNEGSTAKFKVVKSAEREEVYLIKWRGRSYMHCSWERKSDLERFDHSTQAGSARGKINRFLQSQVMTLGTDWKKVLEDGRQAASTPAALGHHSLAAENAEGESGGESTKVPLVDRSKEMNKEDAPDEEDYFNPQFLEVDRILGCDESELDMSVLARQRALNIRAEREALRRREEEDAEEEKWLKGEGGEKPNAKPESSLIGNTMLEEKEDSWDPEDNVRYVVRWKGLQLTEATWEYWIDIKRDFVDEVENFWLRQKAPSADEVKEISQATHPHPKDFKKLTESPVFGVSSRERPIAMLDDGQDDDNKPSDIDSGPVMRLRAYQLEGVNWLLWNWYNRRSCILADEMGLGKTIQSIGFLQSVQSIPQVNVRGPFLIVAPLSLVSQWESESKEWAPDMNVVVYHGNSDARDFLVKQEFYYTDQFQSKSTAQNLRRKHITKFQVLITTYEIVLKDVNVLSKIKWKALIVDEAHRLKNIKSKLFEDLASVPRDFCVLLTGTPLQNSTEELWALLHFCDPTSFASKEEFTDKFGQLTDSDQVANLHTVLRPYLLRRVKEDVEKALPPKEETILEVTLTPIQKTFYKAIYEKNTSFLFKGTKPSNAPSLMNVMMELRKCCNHPFLIRGAEDRIIGDAAATEFKVMTDNKETYRPIDYAKLTGEQLVKSSGKFVLLSKLLPKLQSGGHKVLIFSQMVRVLDLLQELLQLKHYKYERLDGSTSASARNAAVDRFRRESFQRFVMLLSTRAGGLGLNLTAADTVIIFDSDWNPQNDLQAMARAHRIGQTRQVRVYRLLTAKTYEMHMFHSASLKLGLDRAVLAAQRQSANTEEGSSKRKSKAEREEQAKEIDELLKKGAYDVFRDDDDKDAQKFMDTDIDQLLEQSSRKVTYGDTGTSLSSGLGSFSKASFVASTGDGDAKDVDLDDPDFWAKAVGLAAPPEDLDPDLALIIDDGSKRNRKQVQAFDPQADLAEAERKRLELLALQKEKEREEKELQKLAKFLEREEEREEKEKKQKEALDLKEKQLKEKKLKAFAEKDKKIVPKQEKQEKKVKAAPEEKERKIKQVRVIFNERKTDRKRALKRAEHEDPVFERVKQAWDTTQRTRIINAILRFGFGRFCKVRQESNFTSLPIQDVEVFARTYVYQLGLQSASSLLSDIECSDTLNGNLDQALRDSLFNVLGSMIEEGPDFDWICQAILTSLCTHMRMKSHDAFVRIPLILAEPAFVYELKNGVAIRSLHRLSFLSRLNCVIEEAMDRIISDLGYEEMGKRGCPTNDYSTLDLDLKARHVSTEEILHALGINLISSENGGDRFRSIASESFRTRAPWWDRSCDLGLLVGTFIHGLGNYEAMRIDEELPFINKINHYVKCNRAAADSYRRFEVAAGAAKNVFDNALVSMKRKFQQQTHAAVAAVFAAKKKAEKMENAENAKEKNSSIDIKSAYLAKTQKLDDDDIVTLARLKEAATEAFRKPVGDLASSVAASNECKKGPGGRIESSSPHCFLPLPDSNHLDHLLLQIVNNIEMNSQPLEQQSLRYQAQIRAPTGLCCHSTKYDNNTSSITTSKSREIFHQSLKMFYNLTICQNQNNHTPNRVLFAGSLSGVDKRPQDDAADYFLGAASQDLASVAVGADSSRYQRGPCVPLIVTRFGLGALLLADDSVINLVVIRGSDKADDKNSTSAMNKNAAITANPNEEKPLDSKTSEAPTTMHFEKSVDLKSALKSPDENSLDAKSPDEKPLVQDMPLDEPPVWQYIKDNTAIRSSLCSTILLCGYPSSSKSDSFIQLSSALLDELKQNPSFKYFSTSNKTHFFSTKDLFSYSSKISNIDWSDKEDTVEEYFQSVLFPHCLQLCLMLSCKQSNTATSEGKNDVYIGRTMQNNLSRIPDPFIPFEDHSEEAMAHAFIILRRSRLMKSIRFIAGGGVPLSALTEFLRGNFIRKQTTGVPVWWCPWIHDLLVLVHAAIHGLVSVVTDLPGLQRLLIEQHIRDVFINGIDGRKPALPKSFLNNASKEELDAWVEAHSDQFPTPNVIEHRLALICSQLTFGTSAQYDDVPMFDEGGWPMVEDATVHSFIGDTKASGGSCLLRDFER